MLFERGILDTAFWTTSLAGFVAVPNCVNFLFKKSFGLNLPILKFGSPLNLNLVLLSFLISFSNLTSSALAFFSLVK